ncbi:hypothetical protein TNCV_416251 [Trichonephila clavipes]|nr:hypothetical protein TNCV_416251 [Trichonephila clavipes]
MTQNDENFLGVLGLRVLRAIFGGTQLEQELRADLTSDELTDRRKGFRYHELRKKRSGGKFLRKPKPNQGCRVIEVQEGHRRQNLLKMNAQR